MIGFGEQADEPLFAELFRCAFINRMAVNKGLVYS